MTVRILRDNGFCMTTLWVKWLRLPDTAEGGKELFARVAAFMAATKISGKRGSENPMLKVDFQGVNPSDDFMKAYYASYFDGHRTNTPLVVRVLHINLDDAIYWRCSGIRETGRKLREIGMERRMKRYICTNDEGRKVIDYDLLDVAAQINFIEDAKRCAFDIECDADAINAAAAEYAEHAFYLFTDDGEEVYVMPETRQLWIEALIQEMEND